MYERNTPDKFAKARAARALIIEARRAARALPIYVPPPVPPPVPRATDSDIAVYRAEKRRSAKRAAHVMREAKETFDRMMAAAAIKGRGGRPRKAK